MAKRAHALNSLTLLACVHAVCVYKKYVCVEKKNNNAYHHSSYIYGLNDLKFTTHTRRRIPSESSHNSHLRVERAYNI